MSYLKDEEITEQGLWAVEPLLDPSNVGKYVWVDWNGNAKNPSQIQKIGRTNIHCGYSPERTSSYKVEGGHATGSQSGFSIHCCTDAWRRDQEERRMLLKEWITTNDRFSRYATTQNFRDAIWCVGGLLGED